MNASVRLCARGLCAIIIIFQMCCLILSSVNYWFKKTVPYAPFYLNKNVPTVSD